MRSGLVLVLGTVFAVAVAAASTRASEATETPAAASVVPAAVEVEPASAAEPAATPSPLGENATGTAPAPADPEAAVGDSATAVDAATAPVDQALVQPEQPDVPAAPVPEGADPAGSEPGDDAPFGTEPAREPLAPKGPSDDGRLAAEPTAAAPLFGQIGYDELGRSGRIHVVVPGDTLWGISDAYLGTPWVWPSIWTDNDDIENPHLIMPGDHIWITAYEMRRVSPEEAARLLAGEPAVEDLPAALARDELGTATPEAAIVHVSSRETTGLISAQQLESSASVVDSVPPRVMLSQGDQVHIGLGEDAVAVGDQLTVFRTRAKVFDPDTKRFLGYHVDFLGWLEVDEANAETSLATIRHSVSEIELGDRLIPRTPPLLDIEVGPSPEGVEGRISFFPQSRVLMGTIDYVYLNRGELDGVTVGSPLEVYRPGWDAPEPARGTRVQVADRVIAELLVVRAQPETAVALITHTETELELGDYFRGTSD